MVAPQGQQRIWIHQLLKDQMMTDQHHFNSLPNLVLAAFGASSWPSRGCLAWPRPRLVIARDFCIIQPTQMCVPEPRDTRRLSESTMIPKNAATSLSSTRSGLDMILPHQIDRYISHSLFNWIGLAIVFDTLIVSVLQGNDVGTQYRSGIYYYTPEQEKAARESLEQQQKKLNRKIVTEILPAKKFYIAEEYHQQYLEKGGRFGFKQSSSKGCNDPIRCYGWINYHENHHQLTRWQV